MSGSKTITFSGKGLAGDLADPRNWAGGVVPGIADTALIKINVGAPIGGTFAVNNMMLLGTEKITFTGTLDTAGVGACQGLMVCDGAEAVRSMAAGCYDLVLMDIQMPVQDGVSAAREIRTLPDPNGAVPILALTANTLSDQRRAYLDAGMQDCIAKPVNMAELLAKTHEWAGVLRAPAARSRTRG